MLIRLVGMTLLACFVVIAGLMLAGCGAEVTPSPAPTPVPAATFTPIPTLAASTVNTGGERLPLSIEYMTIDELAEMVKGFSQSPRDETSQVSDREDRVDVVDVPDSDVDFTVGYLPPRYELLRSRQYRTTWFTWNSLDYIGPRSSVVSVTEQRFGVDGFRAPAEHTETVTVNGEPAFLVRGTLSVESGTGNARWDRDRTIALYFRGGDRVFVIRNTWGAAPTPEDVVRMAESVK